MDSNQPVSGVERCPVEVVHQIISDLSTADLFNLQITSKFLRATSETSLYKEITWTFHRPSTPKAPIHLLLRTFLSRPELGAHILCLNFTQKTCIHPIWVPGQPKLTDNELEQLAQQGNRITKASSKPDKWLEELQIGNHDAFVTLLLSYCANLRKLVLQNNFRRIWSWNKDCATVPNYNTLWEAIFSLQCLEEIDYDRRGQAEIPWDAHRMPNLLQLPKLSSIKLSIVDEEVCTQKNWNIPEFTYPAVPRPMMYPPISYKYKDPSTVGFTVDKIKAPQLETLHLSNSLVTEHAVGGLVATAPNLKFLSLELKRHVSPFYIDCWVDCHLLNKALVANLSDDDSPSPLESLKIKIRSRRDDQRPDEGPDEGNPMLDQHGNLIGGDLSWFRDTHGVKGSLGSLKRFTNLRRLEVAACLLLGWWPENAPPLRDILPESLTHLCLRHEFNVWVFHEWDTKRLIDLFIQYGCGVANSNLRSVKFMFSSLNLSREADIAAITRLKEVCEDVGLEYEQEVRQVSDGGGPHSEYYGFYSLPASWTSDADSDIVDAPNSYFMDRWNTAFDPKYKSIKHREQFHPPAL